MSNFDAGKIIKRLQKEYGIMPTEKSQKYNKKLICELNAKHREVDSETVKVCYKSLRQAVADEKEKWIKHITGIYILLERNSTTNEAKDDVIQGFTSRREVG